jgi:hypothetical protein
MFCAVRRVPALCDLPWRVLRAKSRSEREFCRWRRCRVRGARLRSARRCRARVPPRQRPTAFGGFSKADANFGGRARVSSTGRERFQSRRKMNAQILQPGPPAGAKWGGPTAAGASSSVTTRSRRQADSGAFHLVGDNSEKMPTASRPSQSTEETLGRPIGR